MVCVLLTSGILAAANFAFAETPTKAIPDSYQAPSDQPGTLTTITYRNESAEKHAIVYTPFGYDAADTDTRYNVLYLMHGGGGNERVWMGSPEEPGRLKHIMDHMIANGDIAPLIVVMPANDYSGSMEEAELRADTFPQEVGTYLMPAVEEVYHTYAMGVTDADFRASRTHRAFGGLSMGGVTTWAMFLHRLDYFASFIPMSADFLDIASTGTNNPYKQDALGFVEMVESFELAPSDYFIYAATGTADFEYGLMSSVIDWMKGLTDLFTFKESPADEGNLMFYVAPGYDHSYLPGCEYLYNALQVIFPAQA